MPSRSSAARISRCRTTTGVPGRQRRSSDCMPDATTLQREEISDRLAAVGYVADRDIATALWLMEFLKRPLLLEGEAGVRKSQGAKGLPAARCGEAIRPQCSPGL